MATIKWSPAARDDLQRLYKFIEPHSQDAAARAIQTLVDAADSLTDFPEKGHPWEHNGDFRELSVRFGTRGYVIRYMIYDDAVVIFRVWHGLEDR